MGLYAVWTIAAYWGHSGHEGMVYGGSLAVESMGGYMIARAYVRDLEDFEATLRSLLLAVFAAALIALPETLLGQNFTHDALRSLTGYVHPTAVEMRMGLTRAYGTFDHPIHYGTFCASLLALAWVYERRTSRRFMAAGGIAGATLLGLSSAPLLCLGLQGGLIVWDKLTRRIAQRTAITVAIIAGLFIGVSIVSTRGPFAIIATGFTLDPWTGFYRLKIWEHGLDNVWLNPLTGIGLAEWQRPSWMVSSTVDAFWLVTTMRAGIPAFLLLFTAIVLLAAAVVRRIRPGLDPRVRRYASAWIMAMIAFGLLATTVHLWNVVHTYFFFFCGLAGWIADPKRVKVRVRKPQPVMREMPAYA